MPNIRPLSDKIVYRQWSRTTQDKGREAGEVQEVSFVTRRPELRTGCSHGHELDRAKPVRQITVNIATNRTAAIGKLTSATNAPKITANPPITSISMVNHPMKCRPDTPLAASLW